MIDLRSAGFQGEGLQYILHDEVVGPLGMQSVAAQTTPCTAAQKSYSPAWHNSITYQTGEFCRIHDSIVNKTAFDHDLNPVTPNIVATEDWFLHRKDNNERMTQPEGMSGGEFYRINPGNQQLREYFTAMALREVKGSATQTKTAFDGVYLDNIQLSWNKVLRTTTPKEYISTGLYSDAVYQFVSQMYTAFHSNGNNYQLWGNMIEGSNDGSQWDRYTAALDGGLLEDFVLNWGNGYHNDQTILNQLNQAQKWFSAGKHYVAVSQGRATDTNHYVWGKFSLAAFLLVTDGVKGSFAYANAANYGPFYDYPEYYFKLGSPSGLRYQVSSNPLIIRRDFECGKAEINLTAKTSSITQTAGCVPSLSSPVPSLVPSPTGSSLPGDIVPLFGKVDIFDYNQLLGDFGKTGTNLISDIYKSGSSLNKIDIFDYNLLLSNYGKVASTNPSPSPSPIPSPAVSPSPGASASSVIKVYAAGIAGTDGVYPIMQVFVNGVMVKEHSNITGKADIREFWEYPYTYPAKVTANQVKVAFINDNGQRDLIVDRINIDGVDYQTEAADTYTNSPGCPTGYLQFETLWCNGYFAYKQ